MDFQSLQKLRFFLSIIFPAAGRHLITPKMADEWFERHPHLKSQLAHLRNSRLGKTYCALTKPLEQATSTRSASTGL